MDKVNTQTLLTRRHPADPHRRSDVDERRLLDPNIVLPTFQRAQASAASTN
jgi:hypothetical protein